MDTTPFGRDSFFELEPFSVELIRRPSPPARIRICPKLLPGSEE